MSPEHPRSRPVAGVTFALAAALLLLGGWGHRVLAGRIDAALGQTLATARPLAQIPLTLADWHGVDVPLDQRLFNVKNFDDEFINRRYLLPHARREAMVFLGYVGRPRTQFGHRPDVCYAAHGAERVSTEPVEFALPDGAAVRGLLYEFRANDLMESRVLVLATYLINGRFSADPDDFRRYNTRNPGLLGEQRAYLARLQVSVPGTGDRSADVAALRDLTARLCVPILESMPYSAARPAP